MAVTMRRPEPGFTSRPGPDRPRRAPRARQVGDRRIADPNWVLAGPRSTPVAATLSRPGGTASVGAPAFGPPQVTQRWGNLGLQADVEVEAGRPHQRNPGTPPEGRKPVEIRW